MRQSGEHFDERTLELYVLKSDLLEVQRADIARHLSVCKGCSSLHKEIEEYYAEAGRLQAAQVNSYTSCLHTRRA